MTPKTKSNMSEQIEKEQIDKIYNCDCLEDEVSPDNTGETTDGKGKIRPELQKKIDHAIRLLRLYDNPDKPVQVSYSGGKDSDVILQLVKESGINYRAMYKNTTIDPPGTIKHVEEMGVEIIRPKLTFFQLVAKRGYPNRRRRYCCQELKEYKILDKVVLGVRKAESSKRSKMYQEPTACYYYRKKDYAELIYPILEWTNEDVEEFIKARGIKCAPIYYDEEGKFHVERRLGCMGCPIASRKHRIEEFKKHPKLVRCYIRQGEKFLRDHDQSTPAKRYGDAYSYFFRNLFCDKEEDYRLIATDLFGKPDFKAFLEKQFGISLS